MQEFMETYKTHSDDIEQFLIETITNLDDLSQIELSKFKKLYDVFPSLELVYICDKISLNQISPNIYRNRVSNDELGNNREYLLMKMKCDSNTLCISSPYMSSATGETCITVTKKEDDKIYFMDFNLIALLQRLGLIEIQKEFNLVSKGFYFIASVIMMLLALFALGYSLIEFIHAVFFKVHLSIESIFKPIIAVTLGLAVFDLSKTVLEQEVVFKSYSKNSKTEYKVLTKFLITIIIALLIESLMVVFKIAISDYNSMINALYLISGVSVLILSLGTFIYLTKKRL
jgi:hypothetical protein